MLEEQNQLLTQTGAGTPMGDLMRRYWMPIAGVSEFEEQTIKPVRLMGEDLVLYKDLSGTYGLIDRHCRHRRADLSYGFVEQCGLRCNYHGWQYDQKGNCVAQPYEDIAHPDLHLKDKVKIKAYPVEAHAGLLWAYLGPLPAPLVPNWEPFTWKNGFVQIVISEIPCNWFQCQENSIDPVHFEWMHANWSTRLQGKTGPYAPRHRKVDFDEFDNGFVYRRVREDTDETDELWSIGRVCLWPNALFTGNHFEWRVPIDDETTLSVGWFFSRVPQDREPYVQNRIPTWHSPIKDPETGRWITSHIMNQDFVAWMGQGKIADRGKEFLATSDKGIALIRRQFFSDLDAIKEGRDPKATVRDPKANECVQLPIMNRAILTKGVTRDQLAKDPNAAILTRPFAWQVGQPDEVRREYIQAMGFELTE